MDIGNRSPFGMGGEIILRAAARIEAEEALDTWKYNPKGKRSKPYASRTKARALRKKKMKAVKASKRKGR